MRPPRFGGAGDVVVVVVVPVVVGVVSVDAAPDR
jgi:hypothetical protein